MQFLHVKNTRVRIRVAAAGVRSGFEFLRQSFRVVETVMILLCAVRAFFKRKTVPTSLVLFVILGVVENTI